LVALRRDMQSEEIKSILNECNSRKSTDNQSKLLKNTPVWCNDKDQYETPQSASAKPIFRLDPDQQV